MMNLRPKGGKRIAFATWTGEPDLLPDDGLVAAFLFRHGHVVVPAPWDSPDVHWDPFLRTTWNYHRAFEAFSDWLWQRSGHTGLLINSVEQVKWNADKRYLLELGNWGVRILPTEIFRRGKAPSLRELLTRRRWRKAVIKPTVSANADGIFLTTDERAGAQQNSFEALAVAGDVMVQEFVEDVSHRGEVSLVYFDGEFSHAVCKGLPSFSNQRSVIGGIHRVKAVAPRDRLHRSRFRWNRPPFMITTSDRSAASSNPRSFRGLPSMTSRSA